jgi:hypothetical protein
MNTIETEKSYPVQHFLDSLNETYMRLVTDVRSSKSANLVNRIEKVNEVRKREQLNQKVTMINKITCSYTYDFEELCNELIKSGDISVSFLLDERESDLLDQ